MPRRPRVCRAGECFHVLNRAVARLPLFEKPEDFEASERVLAEAFEREPLPIFASTVMPAFVNKSQTPSEVDAIRSSVRRGTPFGTDQWVTQSAVRLRLRHTLRPRGRPRQEK